MENSMSRMLVGAIVKKTLRDLKENPERGIRNVVDLALQLVKGRFQHRFFSSAQKMLQNENSAYYRLVRETIAYTDTERLYTFGMNLGYNGCTAGAQRIRENEKKLGCRIPWIVGNVIDPENFRENMDKYDSFIKEGETLGIYTWFFFPSEGMEALLPLVRNHPDSVFFLMCDPRDLSEDFLNEAFELYNLMLVVRYDENAEDVYNDLHSRGLLYSVWYKYDPDEIEGIISGSLFYSIQEISPIFAILLPGKDCTKEQQKTVYQAVQKARDGQHFRMILWDLYSDNRMVDAIISDDTCSVCFDSQGNLWDEQGMVESECRNMFQSSLSDILVSACPK